MAPRQPKTTAVSDAFPPHLAPVNLHAAGMAMGAAEPWAAVAACEAPPVRRCGAHTAALAAGADWRGACAIPTGALESTGVSGIPLVEVRAARGFQVRRVDPGPMPRNGRPPSDGHAGQWLPRLPPYGRLAAGVRPEEQGGGVRSSGRHRAALLAEAARDIPQLQQARTQMKGQRPHGVSALTGVTGLAIRKAILAGARDPQQ